MCFSGLDFVGPYQGTKTYKKPKHIIWRVDFQAYVRISSLFNFQTLQNYEGYNTKKEGTSLGNSSMFLATKGIGMFYFLG